MKKIISLLLAIILCFSVATVSAFAADSESAFESSKEMYYATIEYLNAKYLDTELGSIIEYATPKDVEELTALANYITEDCKTDTEKCDAIYNWMDQNISYSMSNFTAIDVFRNMTGICSGHAQLFSTLSKLSGIPTAILRGFKLNTSMFTISEMYDIGSNNLHEWSIAYCDGEWKVYDDLWGFCGETNIDRIAIEYYIQHVDGIVPYSAAVDYSFRDYTIDTYYINGEFIGYKNGSTFTNYNASSISVGGCLNYNRCYMYPAHNSYYTCDTGTINTEYGHALAGGIYCRLGRNYMYIKPNGIQLEDTTYNYNGNTYFTTGAESIIVGDDLLDNGLTSECFNMYVGQSIDLSRYYPEYKFSVSINKTGVTINNGIVTAVKPGYTNVRIVKNGIGTTIKLKIYDGVIDSNNLFKSLCVHEHTHLVDGIEYCDYCGHEIAVETDKEKQEDTIVTVDPVEEENDSFAEQEETAASISGKESMDEPVKEAVSETAENNSNINNASYINALIKLLVKTNSTNNIIFFF